MSAPAELGHRAAATVAAAAGGRVLVLGSLPPQGRDLDILARAGERERLARALTAAGYAHKQSMYAIFDRCSAYAVELIAAEEYLPPEARDELFEAAVPLDGLPNLTRPAPAHALIILARLAWEERGLRPKRLRRLERIEAEDPGVWSHARAVAARWHELDRLAFLEQARDGRRRSGVPAVAGLRARVGTRGLLVSLSGIDGSGKSSQARWLSGAMTALGLRAEVVWNDLLGNLSLDLVGRPVKRMLNLWRGPMEPLSSYEDRGEAGEAGQADLLRSVWSDFATVSNSLEQRVRALPSFAAGRVVVFDRGPLDLAVRMEVIYRAHVERQRRLVTLAAPRPDLAFLLDISPELSAERKHDIWSPRQLREQSTIYRSLAPRFGVRILDGSRPPHELAAEIARSVWLAR